MKCKSCGLEINAITAKRCPRCNALINLPNKCSECQGCSLFSINKKGDKKCPLDINKD
ncbi:hypothetical protein [Maledivibacter halophilus]|uniref:Uncharacterized protein n=1 Tax=Maledivibacter halophilus TaxID=36842 RepID=A0A1T5L0M8_9FIRM|nr:hypothetical protein [Maledivibacter halophilus]SKC69632.1 hypothetical protein SAMN02194393_02290 [Maledivibacter halophilus]